MKRAFSILILSILAAGSFRNAAAETTASPSAPDAASIEKLTGAKGQLDAAEGVFKVSVPRSDLHVTVRGSLITPPLGLTSWAAFKRVGPHTVVMGDMVLLEDQVNPVMTAALDSGLDVTALHNHFLGDSPHVMYMHIGGMGTESDLATGVGRVFAKIHETSTVKSEAPRITVDPGKSSLDPKRIEPILGVAGTLRDGVYRVVMGRKTQMDGESMGAAMGVNTWAAFAGSDDQAIVDGDIAMLESELQGVLRSLRASGIDVVAIHNHMTFEDPRMIFLHYWGTGSTEDLARGLRAALDHTNQKKE